MRPKPEKVEAGQRWRFSAPGCKQIDAEVILIRQAGGYNLATLRSGTALTVISVEGLLAGGVYLGPA